MPNANANHRLSNNGASVAAPTTCVVAAIFYLLLIESMLSTNIKTIAN
jgi:hypothetical protein